MKKIILFICLLHGLQAHAELGENIEFKAKYVLKDGRNVTGLITLYIADEHRQFGYTDQGFQNLLNFYFYEGQRKLEIEIFKSLQKIKIPPSVNTACDEYAFTDSSSLMLLNLDSIRYTVFLEAKHVTYHFIGVFDNQTFQMLRARKIINTSALNLSDAKAGADLGCDGGVSYQILNFNSSFSQNALNKKLKNLAPKIFSAEIQLIKSPENNNYKIFFRNRKQATDLIFRTLWKEGIVMISVNEFC